MSETKNENISPSANISNHVGDNLSFAAAEAYKKLRTNLLFSLPENEEHCRVVGVTSAIRGDGKTTTSINLACSLADADMRVLLIDADMRLPGVSKILRITGSPGLSNVLTGKTGGEVPYRKSNLKDNLFLLTGGDIPVNPSELLGSVAMKNLMKKLKEEFDFIIMDLPPITIVSDALVVTPLCTGFLLVVRQGYTGTREVESAVKHLKHCKAKILGYVLNGASETKSSYTKAYRNGYYNGDYRTYGSYSQAHAVAESSKKKEEEAAAEIKGLR